MGDLHRLERPVRHQAYYVAARAEVGVVAAKDRAEMAKHFQLPRENRSHLAFLTAAGEG